MKKSFKKFTKTTKTVYICTRFQKTFMMGRGQKEDCSKVLERG